MKKRFSLTGKSFFLRSRKALGQFFRIFARKFLSNNAMQAYEFSTAIHDGIIRIPEQYRNKLTSPVRVILLSCGAAPQAATGSSTKFSAMKLKTKGFSFNREEANER
jgi:hypothetical protein